MDWIAFGGTAIQQQNSPNEAPAYPGQLWQDVSVDTAGTITVNAIWIGVNPDGPPDTSSWFQL